MIDPEEELEQTAQQVAQQLRSAALVTLEASGQFAADEQDAIVRTIHAVVEPLLLIVMSAMIESNRQAVLESTGIVELVANMLAGRLPRLH